MRRNNNSSREVKLCIEPDRKKPLEFFCRLIINAIFESAKLYFLEKTEIKRKKCPDVEFDVSFSLALDLSLQSCHHNVIK